MAKPIVVLLVLANAFGCYASHRVEEDAGSVRDARRSDPFSPDVVPVDTGCVTDNILNTNGTHEFDIGQYCDALFACTDSVEEAEQIERSDGRFECSGPREWCATEYECRWRIGEVDAEEHVTACSISNSVPEPLWLCMVWIT